MKKLHFRDIKQVVNLISSCLHILSRNSPQPGKEFREWPNCPYMRTLLAIEERPAFLPIMRYVSSRINSETFSTNLHLFPGLTTSLGIFIQRVSSCPKCLDEEQFEQETQQDLTFKQLVSRELNELVKLLNVIELNLESAAPNAAHDLFLTIQPAYQEIQNIPDSAFLDQTDVDKDGKLKKNPRKIPLIESMDSLMEAFYKKVDFQDEPEVFNQIKVAQMMIWIFSNRKSFNEFHEAADKIIKNIFKDGMLEGLKLIQFAAKTEVEDIDQIPDAFPNRNLELFKLFVALVLKNMNEKKDDSISESDMGDINDNILDLFRLCLELFPGFECAQMATFDTLITSLHKRYSKIFDIKAGFQFCSEYCLTLEALLELKLKTHISNLPHNFSRRQQKRKKELNHWNKSATFSVVQTWRLTLNFKIF